MPKDIAYTLLLVQFLFILGIGFAWAVGYATKEQFNKSLVVYIAASAATISIAMFSGTKKEHAVISVPAGQTKH